MFVPILTDMFNHLFAQGAIPGSITKGVITLLELLEQLSSRSPGGLPRTHGSLMTKLSGACLADMPDYPCCNRGLEETALHAFYYCERVRPFWSQIPLSFKKLVLLDVGYVVDNIDQQGIV